MPLGIAKNGIVQRHEGGSTTIYRPGRNGRTGTDIEVPEEMADAFRLSAGDVVEGETEPVSQLLDLLTGHDELFGDGWDEQIDEPSALRSAPARPRPSETRTSSEPGRFFDGDARSTTWRASLPRPTERLTRITRINGLTIEDAEDRPFPQTKRSRSERVLPDRWLTLAAAPADLDARMLDFAAPLGAGVFGVVYGPHGAGLTRTLQAALQGIAANAPDCVLLVLLLRSRAEEPTEWKKRAPGADIVVGPAAFVEGAPEETLRLCALMLETAQRQTELGREVVLLIDSLTALWGAMLEAEEADAQQEADNSAARLRIKEWAQKAGCFHGEGLLGGGLGGSLTILGSVWHQGTDIEAEEERDTHPHLRLLEHILPESSWLVALSETLKQRRLTPAIDVKQCRSQYEEKLLPAELLERLLTVRGGLPRRDPVAAHLRVMEALERSRDLPALLERLSEVNTAADAATAASSPASAETEVKKPSLWDLLPAGPDE